MELVADLIDSTSRAWKVQIITDLFDEVDAEHILRIPLAAEPCEDELVRLDDSLGEFSVRSSYKLLHSWSYPSTPNYLQHIYCNFYKQLWNTDLPSKIHITVWRISKEFIPTMANVAKCRLCANPQCLRC